MTAVSVVTPTYNRAHLLGNAYASLLAQSCRDFEWLVVDDGGSDNTRDLVAGWQAEGRLTISYFHKPNGGQHSAINLGVRHAAGELVMLLDSDDRYTPDAIETVVRAWTELADKTGVCGLLLLRRYPDGRTIGDAFDGDRFLSNRIEAEVRKGIRGDKCGVWRREVLAAFPFPEVPGENWLPKSLVWNRITRRYQSLYVNRAIYITDYLPDGLTRQNKFVKLRNPRGVAMALNEETLPDLPLRTRLISARNYIAFSLLAGRSLAEVLREAHAPGLCLLQLLPGVLNGWKRRLQLRRHLRERILAAQARTATPASPPD